MEPNIKKFWQQRLVRALKEKQDINITFCDANGDSIEERCTVAVEFILGHFIYVSQFTDSEGKELASAVMVDNSDHILDWMLTQANILIGNADQIYYNF